MTPEPRARMSYFTPAQAARDAAIDKRHAALIESGALNPHDDAIAIRSFMAIAEDPTKCVEDLFDAMEAHLSKIESSTN